MTPLAASLIFSLAASAPPPASDAPAAPSPPALEEASSVQLAQGERRERRRRVRRRFSSEEREQMRAEVERKVQTFITVELASRLGLDEAKALKLAGAFKAHRERETKERAAMRGEYRKLKELLEGDAKDAALRAQTKKVIAAVRTKKAPDDELFKDTAKFLTPKQQAMLVLSLPEVMRETHRMMKRARRGRRGGGPPDAPAPPPRP